jgi:hypothetical protein
VRTKLLLAHRSAGIGACLKQEIVPGAGLFLRNSLAVLKRVQFLAGLKANSLAWSDADFGAGAGIAADSGFARANAEDAKSAKLNAFARSQRLLQPFKHGVNGCFCFGARQASALDHLMNDVLFDQGIPRWRIELPFLRPTSHIVQALWELWNIFSRGSLFRVRKSGPNAGLSVN